MTGVETVKDEGIGNPSRRGFELPVEQGRWANLPPELLSEIIERVQESETSWPCWDVMSCAAVCKSWRRIIKETFNSPEKCGRLILPISVKQPGPRDRPINCFIWRDKRTSTYSLYYGLVPSEHESDKLLLSATRIRKATSTNFVISLPSDVLSRSDDGTYVGKLRSNFIGRKFTIYERQHPYESSCRFGKKPDPKQLLARAGTISYSVARNTPRRMSCIMNSIPTSFLVSKGKDLESSNFNTTNLYAIRPVRVLGDPPLVLKNKAPWWQEPLRAWCLNFRGRVTVASVKNFQLLLAPSQPSGSISSAEGEKVILQFGKIGRNLFTMDYQYPLSAFQAFAICLSSFGSKFPYY